MPNYTYIYNLLLSKSYICNTDILNSINELETMINIDFINYKRVIDIYNKYKV